MSCYDDDGDDDVVIIMSCLGTSCYDDDGDDDIIRRFDVFCVHIVIVVIIPCSCSPPAHHEL